MRIFIKSARIIDPASIWNGQVKSILIENGKITNIGEAGITAEADQSILEGVHVSPGWLDFQVSFGDPGFEYKEDIESGTAAAAKGGYTGVVVMPSTLPVIQSKSQVDYLKNKATGAVDVFPVGALSQDLEGKEITEMYDMFQSGAVAFSDDKKSVVNSGLMLRALLYSKNFNGIIFSFPDDRNISNKGMMNEGLNSTLLGLKSIPTLAEEIMVNRDIFLAEYSDSRLHFSSVSSKKSVELIRQAKKRGVKITAAVSPHQLFFDDNALHGFDTNFKVNPPLRSKEDIEALIEGLVDGTIDVISSDHRPEDIEMKLREFDHASFGVIGLESSFGALNTILKDRLSLEMIIEKISINPRKILNLPAVTVKEGASANLTIFHPDQHWTFSTGDIRSKSSNTPFIGVDLKGKPLAIINKGYLVRD